MKGVGPNVAKKLLKHFGEDLFEVIEKTPERLAEVDGIGRKRARQIAGVRSEQKAVRDIMAFLYSQGLGTARAVRVYKRYGADAVQSLPTATQPPSALIVADPSRDLPLARAEAIETLVAISRSWPGVDVPLVHVAPPSRRQEVAAS